MWSPVICISNKVPVMWMLLAQGPQLNNRRRNKWMEAREKGKMHFLYFVLLFSPPDMGLELCKPEIESAAPRIEPARRPLEKCFLEQLQLTPVFSKLILQLPA